MMISTKGRYALRVMIDLAQHKDDGFVSLKEIARRQGISQKYLEMIVACLNKAGLVLSQRGKEGGYRLSRQCDCFTVGEIMKLMEEINEQGTTVVVVTHNLEIVKAMNKRVITMQKGVVVDDTASDHYGKDTSVEQDDDLFDDFLDDGGDDDYAD